MRLVASASLSSSAGCVCENDPEEDGGLARRVRPETVAHTDGLWWLGVELG